MKRLLTQSSPSFGNQLIKPLFRQKTDRFYKVFQNHSFDVPPNIYQSLIQKSNDYANQNFILQIFKNNKDEFGAKIEKTENPLEQVKQQQEEEGFLKSI